MKIYKYQLRWPIRVLRIGKNFPQGIYGDLDVRHFRNGKVATVVKVGTELHRDTNTFQFRERYIDKLHENEPDSYRERIINPTTGDDIEKHEIHSVHKRSRGLTD